MSLLTVVRDVCGVVGVKEPTSVFNSINSNRTMFEMLTLANEMAKRIAYETCEWTLLWGYAVFTGDGVKRVWTLPDDYKRMLTASNVYRSSVPTIPLVFISDRDDWQKRRRINYYNSVGEWIMSWDETASGARVPAIEIVPVLAVGEQGLFNYLGKNPINLDSGGVGETFQNDADTFMLDERILKLGMIWQWKANKGSPYAEDLTNYQDALSRVAGADEPAPTIIGRQAMPSMVRATVAVPWGPGWGAP